MLFSLAVTFAHMRYLVKSWGRWNSTFISLSGLQVAWPSADNNGGGGYSNTYQGSSNSGSSGGSSNSGGGLPRHAPSLLSLSIIYSV